MSSDMLRNTLFYYLRVFFFFYACKLDLLSVSLLTCPVFPVHKKRWIRELTKWTETFTHALSKLKDIWVDYCRIFIEAFTCTSEVLRPESSGTRSCSLYGSHLRCSCVKATRGWYSLRHWYVREKTLWTPIFCLVWCVKIN